MTFCKLHNWKLIVFPAECIGKKLRHEVAVNVPFIDGEVDKDKVKIKQAYTSKHNLKRKKQETLLVITEGKIFYYMVVTSLSALLKRITSKYKRGTFA